MSHTLMSISSAQALVHLRVRGERGLCPGWRARHAEVPCARAVPLLLVSSSRVKGY